MVHFTLVPMLAAGLDWLEGLLPLLFIVFWIVSQIVNVIRKAADPGVPRRPEAARPLPPPQPALPPAGAGRADPARDVRVDLEKQIEEFVRRSRREKPAVARQAAPETQRETRRPQIVRPAPRDAVRGNASAEAQPIRREAVQERPLGGLGPGAAGVTRHVQDAFAHDLGHLTSPLASGAGRDAERAAPWRPDTSAAELMAMLRNPVTIRQIVLLREVIDRPVERW
jgi:hypothetical protein